jgi:hypothetical protein
VDEQERLDICEAFMISECTVEMSREGCPGSPTHS